MQLNKEEINIILQIFEQTSVKLNQASVFLAIIDKLQIMSTELDTLVSKKK